MKFFTSKSSITTSVVFEPVSEEKENNTFDRFIVLYLPFDHSFEEIQIGLKRYGLDCSVAFKSHSQEFYSKMLAFKVKQNDFTEDDFDNIRRMILEIIHDSDQNLTSAFFIEPVSYHTINGSVVYTNDEFIIEESTFKRLIDLLDINNLGKLNLWTPKRMEPAIKGLKEDGMVRIGESSSLFEVCMTNKMKIYKDFLSGKFMEYHQLLSILSYFSNQKDGAKIMKKVLKPFSWYFPEIFKFLSHLSRMNLSPVDPCYFSPYPEDKMLYDILVTS